MQRNDTPLSLADMIKFFVCGYDFALCHQIRVLKQPHPIFLLLHFEKCAVLPRIHYSIVTIFYLSLQAKRRIMAELSKLFLNSEIMEVKRSEIHPHPRNPRTIDKVGKDALKRSMKNFGILGGIVINKANNNVLISGHQKVALMDEQQHYDPENPDTDYVLRVEAVEFDEKKELEALTALNNPTIGGKYDFQKLAELIPDIDYKNAGLTEEDLSMIGVDYLFQTEEENKLGEDLDNLMAGVEAEHQEALERQRQQREAIREAQRQANEQQDAQIAANQEKTAEEKKQHMKDVKEQVKTQAIERAMDQEAYIMLSFDNFQSKREFMARAGYPEDLKFIKAEEFAQRIEFIE